MQMIKALAEDSRRSVGIAARPKKAAARKRIASVLALTLAVALALTPAPLFAAGAPADQVLLWGVNYGGEPLAQVGTKYTLTRPYAAAQNEEIALDSIVPNYNIYAYSVIKEEYSQNIDKLVLPSDTNSEASVDLTVTYKANQDGAVEQQTTLTIALKRAPATPATFNGNVNKPANQSFLLSDFEAMYTKGNLDGGMTGISINYMGASDSAKSLGTFSLGGVNYSGGFVATTAIAGLSFIPASGATGTATFTVVAHNDLTGNLNFVAGSATLTITITPPATPTPTPSAQGSLSQIEYSSTYNYPVYLSPEDFTSAYNARTNGTLDRIRFTIYSSDSGRLYFNLNSHEYSVGSSDEFYLSSRAPYISDVYFIPRTGYEGATYVQYYAYGSNGVYEGSIRFNYSDYYYSGGSTGTGSGGVINNTYTNAVNYLSENRQPIWIASADLNSALVNSSGRTLASVRFIQPSSDVGQLYFRYGSSNGQLVTNDTRYYRNSSPDISNVAFIPTSTFTGLAAIQYTAYSSNGYTYAGTVFVRVGIKSSDPVLNVSYDLTDGAAIALSADDFQSEVQSVVGSSLSYVTFSQGSGDTALGKLYLGYASASSPGTAVTPGTRYYRSSTPSISNVYFVPTPGVSGEASVSFTAYVSSALSFSGKLTIDVSGKRGELPRLSFTSVQDEQLYFVEARVSREIRAALSDEDEDSPLSYMTFRLPPSRRGDLIHVLGRAAGGGEESVDEDAPYYDKPASRATSEEPSLSAVVFEPARGFTGTVSISYTAFTDSGVAYDGTLSIDVEASGGDGVGDGDGSSVNDGDGATAPEPGPTEITFPNDWSLAELSSLAARNVIPIDLFADYDAPITRAEFTAALVSAVDSKPGFAPDETRAAEFSDISDNRYADLIARGYAVGIIDGVSDALFDPDAALTREQAAKILCAAAQIPPQGADSDAGASGGAERFADFDQISDWAAPYVASATGAGLINGDEAGRFLPLSNLTRKEALALVERAFAAYLS